MKEIVDILFSKQDIKYRSFQAPLFPNIAQEKMIGVRTPELKKLAKEINGSELANKLSEELGIIITKSNVNHMFRDLHDLYLHLKGIKL